MFGRTEEKIVMDNIRTARDHIAGRSPALQNPLARLLTLVMGLYMSSAALSAVISINASQNQDNVIEVSGDLQASVEYTANGLKIEIPGVNIKLTCDGADVTEQAPCTIDLKQGDGSSVDQGGDKPDGNNGVKPPPEEGAACELDDGSQGVIEGGVCTAPNPYAGVADGEACELESGEAGKVLNEACVEDPDGDNGLTNNPEEGAACELDDGSQGEIQGGLCKGKWDSFCAAGRNPNVGANPELFDEKCDPETNTVKDGVDNSVDGTGGGYGTGNNNNPGNNKPGDDDPCAAGGFPSPPECSASDGGAGLDSGPTRDLFKDTRGIVDYTVTRSNAQKVGPYDDGAIVDLGSAGIYGSYERKRTVTLPKGKIGVVGFTLAPPTTLGDYCAAGEGAAAEYFGKDFNWEERCNDDGTLKDFTDFCAAGREAAADKDALFGRVCTEDNAVEAGEEPQPERRIDTNQFYLTYSESTTQADGDLHLWVSETKDGDPIENCGFARFVEGAWELSVGVADDNTNKKLCDLTEGRKYYMMVAFCQTSSDDISCKADDAKTSLRDGNMSLNPNWYRTD